MRGIVGDRDRTEALEAASQLYHSLGDDGAWRHKASQLFVEVGRRRMASRDDSTAIKYLRRAAGIDPYSKGSSVALEQALSDASQWQELDRMLRHRSNVVQDPAERAEVLRRRAALYRNQLPRSGRAGRGADRADRVRAAGQ